jgi:hypothetical protein
MPQPPCPQRAALALMMGAVLSTSVLADDAASRRLAPPETAGCARDHLTLYSGLVISYRRVVGRTTLRIRTDWDTTETVSIRHPGGKDPSPWFLIERATFTAADWVRIEASPGKLKPSMRAAAWVCDNGSPSVVDWQPPRLP